MVVKNCKNGFCKGGGLCLFSHDIKKTHKLEKSSGRILHGYEWSCTNPKTQGQFVTDLTEAIQAANKNCGSGNFLHNGGDEDNKTSPFVDVRNQPILERRTINSSKELSAKELSSIKRPSSQPVSRLAIDTNNARKFIVTEIDPRGDVKRDIKIGGVELLRVKCIGTLDFFYMSNSSSDEDINSEIALECPPD